jgi:hypothetical protein
MTKPDFHRLTPNELLDCIGWSKPTLAHRTGVGLRVVSRWCNSGNPKYEMPVTVRDWLICLAEFHWFHPHPKDWT